jgi:hypothetical protein
MALNTTIAIFRLHARFKRWLETQRLRRTAKKAIADPQASIAAMIAGQAILIGLAERKAICRHCFQPFEPKERTFNEWFQLRAILMIADTELNPMLCEKCFETAVTTYNPQATNIGTSNSGHANMVLKNLG